MPVLEYLQGMRRFFADNEFSHVLCSHQPHLYPREMPERFLETLTPGRLGSAYPVPLWSGKDIDPCRCDVDEQQYLVFDRMRL